MPDNIVIQDPHNPSKSHLFRVYKDRHVAYDQLIDGRRFYKRYTRINKKHGYYHLYSPVKLAIKSILKEYEAKINP